MESKIESKIVKLNVGGETFVTSSSTLLSGGESFFSSLLSGRHKSEQDENGAFFIDRSPKYFSPILQYLRSSVLDIPDGYKLSLMRTEAEFYGIQKIIDHIDFLEAEKKDLDSKKRDIPIYWDKGCYVEKTNTHALLFSDDNKLIKVSNDYERAFDQAMVVRNHQQLPVEWSSNEHVAGEFAKFYQKAVRRGKYAMNADGKGLLLELDNFGISAMASFSEDFTLLSVCTTGFGINDRYVVHPSRNFSSMQSDPIFILFEFRPFAV